jgi:enamine deaminase RidA (YjgF/YER057c/UK114 family)
MSSKGEPRSRSFHGVGGTVEHFISVTADGTRDLGGQIEQILERYQAAQDALGLAAETAVFRRVFISDAMNQAKLLRESALVRTTSDDPVAVSLVQQPPLPGAKLALLAYHRAGEGPIFKRRLSPHHLLVTTPGQQRHLWTTGLCAAESGAATSSALQTREIFGELIQSLAQQGATLRDHCLRTWIYLKDVDVFYQGMVEARAAVFAAAGLRDDTHFIASTGIEGGCAHRYDLVAMDAYSNLDVEPQQISYLNDFDRLCATKNYNVHFERGTRVEYADRAHCFISGTASIDRNGQIVHEGDALRQLDRALGNVEALLRSGAAELADLMHLTVYLRDPTDYTRVAAALDERFPSLPSVIVQGAVCRPQWLVEVEGIAIVGQDVPTLPSL